MVGITALWLPIVLSSVIVFIASSIIHMALPFHRNDWSGMPDEDAVLEAMRKAGVRPGDYSFPYASCPADLRAPEMVAKYDKGPVGFATILPSGPPAIGKRLMLWFVFTLFVGVLVAYITGRTVGQGVDYLQVFRVAGTAGFLAYAGAEPVESIWKGRKWTTTGRMMVDGLVYALLTAGMFGWLWPR